jgi:hypothetical protein
MAAIVAFALLTPQIAAATTPPPPAWSMAGPWVIYSYQNSTITWWNFNFTKPNCKTGAFTGTLPGGHGVQGMMSGSSFTIFAYFDDPTGYNITLIGNIVPTSKTRGGVAGQTSLCISNGCWSGTFTTFTPGASGKAKPRHCPGT